MKLYVFLVIFFIFAGISFAETSKNELREELRSFGWDDFILRDDNAQTPQDSEETQDYAEESDEADESKKLAEGEEDEETVVVGASRGGRAPMSGGFIAGGGGPRGGGGPSGPRTSVFETAEVGTERSIDFSRNAAEHRSPQRAMFLSLLVPGLGQAYNRDFWRTGLYLTIEGAMIGGAIYFNRDSRRIMRDAERFADANFDQEKLRLFYANIITDAQRQFPENSIDDINEIIFGVFANNDKGTAIENFFADFERDFYGRSYGVGSRRFSVQGWADASWNTANSNELFAGGHIDSAYNRILSRGDAVFGLSALQNEYISQLDRSRLQSRRSSVFVVGIVANHIASATDAFISAIIHNRRLLREESSEPASKRAERAEEILSRISLESNMYFDGQSDLTTRMGLVWRF